MTTREKVGLVILWWMLKLVNPFKYNFELDKLKDDIKDIIKDNHQ